MAKMFVAAITNIYQCPCIPNSVASFSLELVYDGVCQFHPAVSMHLTATAQAMEQD